MGGLPQEAHPPQVLGGEGLVSLPCRGSVEASFPPPGPSCLSGPVDVLHDITVLHSVSSNRPTVQFIKIA